MVGKRKRATSGGARKRRKTSSGFYAKRAKLLKAPLRTGGWGPRATTNGAEKKYNDVVSSGAFGMRGGTTLPALVLLNGIKQGTDINQRVGRKVTLKSLNFHATVQTAGLAQANTYSPAVVRMMIVVDSQANGTAPTVDSILEGATTLPLGHRDINAPNNLANRDRYRVLYNKTFTVEAKTGIVEPSPTNDRVKYMYGITSKSKYIRLNLDVVYGNIELGIADIQTNSVYMILMAGGLVDNSWCPTYNLFSRVRYTDT